MNRQLGILLTFVIILAVITSTVQAGENSSSA